MFTEYVRYHFQNPPPRPQFVSVTLCMSWIRNHDLTKSEVPIIFSIKRFSRWSNCNQSVKSRQVTGTHLRIKDDLDWRPSPDSQSGPVLSYGSSHTSRFPFLVLYPRSSRRLQQIRSFSFFSFIDSEIHHVTLLVSPYTRFPSRILTSNHSSILLLTRTDYYWRGTINFDIKSTKRRRNFPVSHTLDFLIALFQVQHRNHTSRTLYCLFVLCVLHKDWVS